MKAFEIYNRTRDRGIGAVQPNANLFYAFSIYDNMLLTGGCQGGRQIQDQSIRVSRNLDYRIYRVRENYLELYFVAEPDDLYLPDCCVAARPLRHTRRR
ncbi:MAG: hypothetical protein WAL05_05210 [Candidatus Sulfotelmatobacter sp.]